MHELPENWNTLFRRLLWAFLGIILGRLFTSSLFYCSLGEHLLFELVYAKKQKFLCVLKEAFCIENFLVSKYSLDLCIFAKSSFRKFVNDNCWIIPTFCLKDKNWPSFRDDSFYRWHLWKLWTSPSIAILPSATFFIFPAKS